MQPSTNYIQDDILYSLSMFAMLHIKARLPFINNNK